MINLYQYKNQLDYWYDERKNIKFPFYKKSYIKTFHSTKKSTPARHPYKKTPGVLQKAPAYAGLQKRREFAGECVSNK